MNTLEMAKKLVDQMSIAEKTSLCSGKDFWYLKGIERLELPEIMVTDGPHGLRKQEIDSDNLGINQSIPAVCFPTTAATACSFDRGLLKEIGKTIGEECRQENVAVLLGPGVNIKRSPLCGRNFEYFSEDPFLTGELAAAFIEGVQSQNVGTSIKHFAANNQEKRRMTIESVIDERTFREIYLAGFEMAIKKSKPWTVMCSYNRLFGEYACQNKWLLTDILRNEWEFDGLVISDWGATVDRVKSLEAGMDLEMPWIGNINDQRIIDAVEKGDISQETLDTAAIRVTELILKSQNRQSYQYDANKHHAFARFAESQSAILLKNIGNILPGRADQKIAIIGQFAKQPRYQGTGSSKIEPIKIDNAREEFRNQEVSFDYANGYHLNDDDPDESLIKEACQIAMDKDIVYIFAGLPDSYESETFDRESMSMPEGQNALIQAVCQVNRHVVVVLHAGAPVEIPWIDQVQGILMMYLGGEACGSAAVDLLLGKVNPSGKLAETWPFHHTDAPSHDFFPGYSKSVEYRENLFVGYRYYDTARKTVCFPFGYGQSYTTFDYQDFHLSAESIDDTDELTITCKIKNTGSRAGSEIAQLYVSCKDSKIIRAEQELKGFDKVFLEPGESKEIQFVLSQRDFAYFNRKYSVWHVETGEFEIRIGSSSRSIFLSGIVHVNSTQDLDLPDYRSTAPCYYDLSKGLQVSDKEFEAVLGYCIPLRERPKGALHTINSTFTDIQDKWFGRLLLSYIRKQIDKLGADNPDMKMMADKMLMDMPLRFLTMMSASGQGGISMGFVEGIVDILNKHLLKGIKVILKERKES